MFVGKTVLQVDHRDEPAAAEDGHREKRLVVILRQLVEQLEPRIFERVAPHDHRLPVFGDPSGDALPHPQLEAVDDVPARLLGRAQHELIALEHVDQAGVALHDAGDHVHHTAQHRLQRFGSGEPAADLVQEADLRVAGPADQRFLFSHVRMFLLRGIRASLRPEQCVALLRHFLDEKSHLGVRRLDVDRQAVAHQFLGRHRSD